MNLSAQNLDFRELNEWVRISEDAVIRIDDCFGQRFIGSGLKDRTITVNGTPGNALGAYLDGAEIHVRGNAQDAVGDTMNSGTIVIHGNAGDALGYAMRGGCIYVRGNAGYRTGIHMKEYRGKKPVIVVGGGVGSFLGEYLAGGIIIVLNIDKVAAPVGNFPGTGMHGGKILIRGDQTPSRLPEQVCAAIASSDDIQEIEPYITAFAGHFGMDAHALLKDQYCVLSPNAKNPYTQLYVAN